MPLGTIFWIEQKSLINITNIRSHLNRSQSLSSVRQRPHNTTSLTEGAIERHVVAK